MTAIVSRRITFATPYHKAKWLAGQAKLDSLLLPVQAKAREFLIPSAMARVDQAFRYVRDHIRYVHDPNNREQFADAAVVLQRGFDDCDGKARTLAALLHAAEHISPVGVEVELVPVFPEPDIFSHVTVQVRWPKSTLFWAADKNGWIRAETILAGARLGTGSESARRGPDGKIIFS